MNRNAIAEEFITYRACCLVSSQFYEASQVSAPRTASHLITHQPSPHSTFASTVLSLINPNAKSGRRRLYEHSKGKHRRGCERRETKSVRVNGKDKTERTRLTDRGADAKTQNQKKGQKQSTCRLQSGPAPAAQNREKFSILVRSRTGRELVARPWRGEIAPAQE